MRDGCLWKQVCVWKQQKGHSGREWDRPRSRGHMPSLVGDSGQVLGVQGWDSTRMHNLPLVLQCLRQDISAVGVGGRAVSCRATLRLGSCLSTALKMDSLDLYQRSFQLQNFYEGDVQVWRPYSRFPRGLGTRLTKSRVCPYCRGVPERDTIS